MTHIEREKRTVAKMIEIYCHNHHNKSALCAECQELVEYASSRLDNCPFGEKKGVCNRCKIHCYKPSLRAKISEVMRYSGKRMILYSPCEAVRHLIKIASI